MMRGFMMDAASSGAPNAVFDKRKPRPSKAGVF
jgi:hypothetical protein